VVRVRCKRRLRELFRLHPEELRGLNVDLVVNARSGCAEAPWEELRRDYRRCVNQLSERLSGD
jgi:ribonuclease P protein component